MEKTHVLVVGNNGRWAKEEIGADESAAILKARKAALRPPVYNLYRVTEDTAVNDYGALTYMNPDELETVRPEWVGQFKGSKKTKWEL